MKRQKMLKSFAVLSLLVGVMFCTSCSNSPENLKLIPKDANFIMSMDAMAIATKGKLSECDSLEMFQALNKKIEESEDFKANWESFKNDPSSTGIDFSKKIHLYIDGHVDNIKSIALVADLLDASKFETTIIDLSSKDGEAPTINEEEGVKTMSLDNEVVLAWDKSKAIIAVSPYSRTRKTFVSNTAELFKLEAENQITSNEKFNEFYKRQSDVSYYVCSNIAASASDFSSAKELVGFALDNSYLYADFNFEQNSMSTAMEFDFNEELDSVFEVNNFWDNTFDNEMLKYFPKENINVMSASTNPMALYNIMSSIEEFESAEGYFKMQSGLEVKDVFESLKGNYVLSMIDLVSIEKTEKDYKFIDIDDLTEEDKNDPKVTVTPYGAYKIEETTVMTSMPRLAIMTDIYDNNFINSLMSQIPQGMLVEENGYYAFPFPGTKMSLYFAYNDKYITVTNHEDVIKAFVNGGFEGESLADTDFAEKAQQYKMYAKSTNPDMSSLLKANPMLATTFSDFNEDVFKEINEMVIGSEGYRSEKNKFEGHAMMKESENNSLYDMLYIYNSVFVVISENMNGMF